MTTPAILPPRKMERSDALLAARQATRRVIGSTSVNPATFEAIRAALFAVMYWEIPGGELRRIVEAHR